LSHQDAETEQSKSQKQLLIKHDNFESNKNYVTYLSPNQFDEFTGGLFEIVPREVFESGVTVTELRSLLFGQVEIDDQDLYNHWTLIDYDESSEHIQWLKRIFTSWSQENRRNFLKFVTGNPQLSPNGFAGLQPDFKILRWFQTPDHFPQTHNCYHQIDIPQYTSEDQMRQQLELAISTESEFSMS
jgi:E3 ubiquitin-protein ligase TRIP12